MSMFSSLNETAGSGAAVLVTSKKRTRSRSGTRPRRQSPYAVIVHNDNEHTFPYVIELLQRVCGHARPKAYLLTCEIHFSGCARVWSGSLEVAELKRDQIRGYGPDYYGDKPVTFPLGVTLEPLPAD